MAPCAAGTPGCMQPAPGPLMYCFIKVCKIRSYRKKYFTSPWILGLGSKYEPSVPPSISLRPKTIRERGLLSMLRSSWLADALFQTLASLCPVWPGDNFLCGSAGLASACRTWPWCCEPQPWKHAGHAHTEAWFARLKDCGQLVASTVASGHQLGDMTPRMLLRMLNELRMITKPVSVKASPWFLE